MITGGYIFFVSYWIGLFITQQHGVSKSATILAMQPNQNPQNPDPNQSPNNWPPQQPIQPQPQPGGQPILPPQQAPYPPQQPPQQPQQQVHYHVNQPSQSNGMATAGFILSFFIAALGLIFSIIGLQRSKELNGSGRGLALAGIIISCISIAIGLLWFLVLVGLIGASSAVIQEAAEELEELEEGSLEVYSSFNVDNRPQAVKVITGDPRLGQFDDEFYYSPETPETCQYYLTNHAVERDTVDTLEYWTEYTAPITLSPLEPHVIAQGCGEWEQVDSL